MGGTATSLLGLSNAVGTVHSLPQNRVWVVGEETSQSTPMLDERRELHTDLVTLPLRVMVIQAMASGQGSAQPGHQWQDSKPRSREGWEPRNQGPPDQAAQPGQPHRIHQHHSVSCCEVQPHPTHGSSEKHTPQAALFSKVLFSL